MADESHEISIGGELTPTGVKAHVRSRFASALDRFFGSKIDRKSVPIEAENTEASAIAAGRVKMIEALSEMGVQKLKADPVFAARAIENFLPELFRKQENKDGVMGFAADDLKLNPPSEAESTSGPEELSDEFLNRFERYAEDASTEEVREKWGRVLAAEIRKPNTFSGKVLRVIDELDSGTATLFERVCQHCFQGVLLKATLGELPFSDITQLVGAGLIVDPGFGQIQNSVETTDSTGVKLWMFGFGQHAIALVHTATPLQGDAERLKLAIEDGKPALPVYVLTDVGRALTSILPDQTGNLFALATEELTKSAPQCELRLYTKMGDGTRMAMTRSIPPRHNPA